MSASEAALHALELDEERFVGLLRNLIGEVEHLQNTGVGTAYVPQEDLAIKHCLEVLAPHRKENGGPLEVEHVTYAGTRGRREAGGTSLRFRARAYGFPGFKEPAMRAP